MTTFSVAMTTYNGAPYLEPQLASIAGQTRLPDEIVIGDDQSSDATPELVAAFARRHPDLRLRFERNAERLGSNRNFEAVARRCTGDVIVFCDQDDLWMPNRIARVAEIFESDPDVGYVACDGAFIDGAGRLVGATLFSAVDFVGPERQEYRDGGALRVLLRRNVITGAALAVRRETLLRALPFEPGWVHDYFLGFALEALGRGVLLDDCLIHYRRHQAQQLGVALPGALALLAAGRRQDAGLCQRDAAKFRALKPRLIALGLAQDHWVLGALEDKARLYDARARMRQHPLHAPGLIWRAFRSGDYARYSLGWKQGAVDTVSSGLALLGRGRGT
jgi:glycosyltransferase involved in cell wall biosynthesis